MLHHGHLASARQYCPGDNRVHFPHRVLSVQSFLLSSRHSEIKKVGAGAVKDMVENGVEDAGGREDNGEDQDEEDEVEDENENKDGMRTARKSQNLKGPWCWSQHQQ